MAADPVRMVNVSSDAQSMGPKGGIMFDDLGQAKESTMFVDSHAAPRSHFSDLTWCEWATIRTHKAGERAAHQGPREVIQRQGE